MKGLNPLPILDILQPLLAAGSKSRYSSLGSRNRGNEPRDFAELADFAIVLGTVLLFGLLAWIAGRLYTQWQKRVINSPRKLFHELCQTHGLVRADRELLREIARWHGLKDPVQLFFEPARFQSPEMRTALECEAAAFELEARLFANP